jgi:V8-like Glu-specific endopeptidase
VTGFELAEVREAILGAYQKRSFDRLLLDRFGIRRGVIAGDGPLRDIVDDVLAYFADEGREAHLLAEIAADRPGKPEIVALYHKYAATLLSDRWRSVVDERVAEQLERFGLLPVAELWLGGAAQESRSRAPAGRPTFGGFQKQVRATLPEIDVLSWTSLLMRQTCRVCRVEVSGSPQGSGFLVGPDMVMTSYHVVSAAIRARLDGQSLAFVFDYWRKPNGQETAGMRVAARGAWQNWHVDSTPPLSEREEHAGMPEPTDDQLDHALIALDRALGHVPVVPGGPQRGWIEIPATEPVLVPSMPIAILHYPRTGPVKFTFDTSALHCINHRRTRMRYATNTDGGSSGAPCLGIDLQLLGIHHFSDIDAARPTYNQGIPITAVYKRLQRIDKVAALGTGSP